MSVEGRQGSRQPAPGVFDWGVGRRNFHSHKGAKRRGCLRALRQIGKTGFERESGGGGPERTLGAAKDYASRGSPPVKPPAPRESPLPRRAPSRRGSVSQADGGRMGGSFRGARSSRSGLSGILVSSRTPRIDLLA